MKFTVQIAVLSLSCWLAASISHAGVGGEMLKRGGRHVGRWFSGEAAETGAKATGKTVIKQLGQEAVEAAEKSGANVLAKGGAGDEFGDFMWRNKGIIAGTAVVATLVANPEESIAASEEILETSINATAEKLVAPVVVSVAKESTQGLSTLTIALAAVLGICVLIRASQLLCIRRPTV